MSNTRHTPGPDAPRAERRRELNGTPVPPSEDVAQTNLADIIGKSVAAYLGGVLQQLLSQLAQQTQGRGECFFCILAAKKVVHDHQVACQIALQAGEDQPELPPPPAVATGITQLVVNQIVATQNGPVVGSGSVWACWDHIELPQAPPRQTGLVGPDGTPLLRA